MHKCKWILKKNIDGKYILKCIKLAKKRQKGIPIQYILKNWEFYGVPIKLTKGVLIPRQDTEKLVDVALKIIKKNDIILELGTGSGCISAAIAKNIKNVKIFAVEKYFKAYSCAKRNLKNFKNTVSLIKGDILNEKFASKFENINLIISNPPYLTKKDIENMQLELKFEPKQALYGGVDGLDYYRKIAKIYKNSLKKGSHIVFEISHSGRFAVEDILKYNGFSNIQTYKDLTCKDRVVVGKI